ncbi:MAG: proline--tRNA ligase [Thermomicrobiales bacterium]
MSQPQYVQDIADQTDNFDQWYVDVIQKAELADDSPVRGTKILRPYGYGIWEHIQRFLDDRFKATGVENAYFPLLIPKSMLEREADHIEGFTPEAAWVTIAGGKELEEPLAIRPTSESIICPTYARWVQSWRDLPIVLNQWCSVLRWEERPRAFLRTSEFLWQEGHTAHATPEEAEERARQMLEVYRTFLEEELAIPVIAGQKSESEKFAGALRTYTVEAMMGGKSWALQAGTSHNLGDHFARAFDIRFLDRDGERKYAHSTSWGLSHRTIGATIMVHGDERGLKLPPKVAPVQAAIVPILGRNGGAEVLDRAHALAAELRASGIRVAVDDRDDRSPGFKFNHWELKGVPVRIELGPRDLAADQAVMVSRDTGIKIIIPLAGLTNAIVAELTDIHDRLLAAAGERLAANVADVATWEEMAERVAANAGWNRVWWDGSAEDEARIKAETKATIRCIPFTQSGDAGRCIATGRETHTQVIVARAY